MKKDIKTSVVLVIEINYFEWPVELFCVHIRINWSSNSKET